MIKIVNTNNISDNDFISYLLSNAFLFRCKYTKIFISDNLVPLIIYNRDFYYTNMYLGRISGYDISVCEYLDNNEFLLINKEDVSLTEIKQHKRKEKLKNITILE